MENFKKKYILKKNKKLDTSSFGEEYKISMSKKCENNNSKLFYHPHSFSLDKIKNEEIFTQFKEKINHENNEQKNTIKLNENIENLEELSKEFGESMKKLILLFEIICDNKEEFILKIRKIFTEIRNIIKKREENLIIEVDKFFNDQNNSIFSPSFSIENEKKIKPYNNISFTNSKILYQKAKKSICEIILKDGYGSGFFCKIKNEENEICCLLTSYHIIT